VLHTTIQHRAQPDKLPAQFLVPRRHDGAGCGLDDGTIRKTTVNGRATYYCPRHQR
jgi:formamidopyrimidine-DNA glycosylase